jgi:hypothetical protein
LEKALAGEFSFWTPSELTSRAEACSGADAASILMMTVAANKKHDPAVQTVIEKHLASPSRDCRQHAALAAGLVRWPELRPVLESALTRERDAEIRTIETFVLGQIPAPKRR